ncbi:MAG: hypothetical protein JNL28_13830 [Planctomycetes bacterium]|nr:hypothetical protein [Planctomycetota bacterium]
MNQRKQFSGTDWLGIALFALGSIGAVLMLLAMSTSGPVEEQGWLGPVAALWKNTLGIFPSLFMNATIAFMGARLFLGFGFATLKRNLIGCAGLALALSVVCGAWKGDAGGFIGSRTGAIVTEYTHVALGTLIGLISFFAVAWFAWFRAPIALAQEQDAPAPVLPVLEKSAAKASNVRPAVHKTIAANEGVSAAESAALFPVDEIEDVEEPVVVRKLSADEAARAALAPFSQQETPASPYPEDVRRKGQIPVGTKPLENPNASAQTTSAVSPPPVYHWTAPHIEDADDGAGAHLVGQAPADDRAEVDEVEVSSGSIDADGEAELELNAEAQTPTNVLRFPVRPSWEREPAAVEPETATFQPEEGDEEPVDAYGTPLTLVEQLRQARRESGFSERDALPNAEGDAIEVEASHARLPREVDAEIEETLVDSEVDLDADEEVEVQDEDEYESEEVVEVESTVGEDVEDEEFDEDEEEQVEEEVLAESELETEELVVAEAEVPVVAPTPAPTRATRSAEQQKGLFDPDAEEQPVAAEREVVLKPKAAAAPADRSPKSEPIAADVRGNQLSEIGCLFIERGRVAVSMLQRQYEMDFDAACKVLDDLQEMGLIGPYLGGQRRDILLTREQWLERVSQAGATR